MSEPKPQSYFDDENVRSNSTETTASSRPQAPRRCYLSAPLDAVRANKEVRQILEEIVLHLQNAPGAKVTVKLEVEAESSEGFTPDIVRVVSENWADRSSAYRSNRGTVYTGIPIRNRKNGR